MSRLERVARARKVLEDSRAAGDDETVPYNAAAWAGRLDAALEMVLAADKDGDVVLVSRADLEAVVNGGPDKDQGAARRRLRKQLGGIVNLQPSACVAEARKVLEETAGDGRDLSLGEMAADRFKLRAALEQMLAYADEQRQKIAEEIEAEQAEHERTYRRTPTSLGSALWCERQRLTRLHAEIARGDRS